MKLYKYRPLSEFLYKELFYWELYFASYPELNDPLDLSARIEFTPQHLDDIDYLLYFLFKTTLILSDTPIIEADKKNNQELLSFIKDDNAKLKLSESMLAEFNELATRQNFIAIEDIENIVYVTTRDLGFNFNLASFKIELERLTKKFLQNSYVTCFTENNNSMLMWAHYASNHTGVCLEFDLKDRFQFPFIVTKKRKQDKEKYLKRISNWT